MLAVHGIGAQVPFETLELLARALCSADRPSASDPIATNVAFDSKHTAQRLEVLIRDEAGAEVEVHLYEAYWASITEGATKLRDVFRFLARGCGRSLIAAPRPFFRWAFHGTINFGTQWKSFWQLLALTLLLLNLAILNLVIPAMAGLFFAGRNFPFGIPDLFVRAMVVAFDALLLAFLLSFLTLWIAYVLKRDHPRATTARRPFEIAALVFLVTAVALLVLLPEALALLWFWHPLDPSSLTSGVFRVLTGKLALGATWGLLLIVTLCVRYFFVEYLGDIVAYVNPQALDRFAEIRRRIRVSVCETARLILGHKDGGADWYYESMAFVGHSLGSVIAYDTINQLLVDDVLGVTSLGASERVTSLVTFGSPLDKTAFIFGLHGVDTRDLREKLAARVQPLIEDYDNRRHLTWWNVYSPYDPISDRLRFYDKKANAEYPVGNRRDGEARIPLLAHLEYWANPTVWKLLHACLTKPHQHGGSDGAGFNVPGS